MIQRGEKERWIRNLPIGRDCTTIQDVAHPLGVSWDIVKDIQKRYLQQHYSRPALKDARHIGIDEICVAANMLMYYDDPASGKRITTKVTARSDAGLPDQ